MIFEETPLKGAFVIGLDKKIDHRGYFARGFCQDTYKSYGLNPRVSQANLSYSKEKHTLRGFHYQTEGGEEAKSLRCLKGKILDVIIDLRIESPTYGKHFSVELSESNGLMLYVPEGFAHAFLTLEPNTEVFYLVSNHYQPEKERGIRWNDPALDIQWPTSDPILSEKDRNHPDFEW